MTAAPRIAFLASTAEPAQRVRQELIARYGDCSIEEADVLCALGGDGFMLRTLHRHGASGKPVYGMKLGSVGFLMNQYHDDLLERLQRAEPAKLRPLQMMAQTESGVRVESLAYNEVSLLRQTHQVAYISIDLNGQTRIDELTGDGVIVATPAGSTAYNYSAHGPILPLGSHTLALTPIAPYRPRRWRGAILKADTEIRFRVLDPYKRPVSVTADSHEIRDVVEVTIRESTEQRVTLLFDPEHNLEERIFSEQFAF
ncbi:NAD kinase [Xylella fastidiosa subsp. multiplex]|uniref:NAD kinase n=1 Tax=Xylella fastidiosa subsp. multiplex TaxID=644357 RepID=A0A9Q4QRJ2_XYLFS|nr:NAD kinase [Xylella fastidiosa]KAJ4852714.1 NAD kinase [Xylella fastidiosa subsp. multiplex]KAJ4852822.1 NAD kinase [Xylella fastidiosa subsp. multiplex]MBE0269504.1 NAD kinase [Xylella fastidiosa subsp. multiplex]MBE0276162.1 NAD kinase [Xylella fastidiosa subsp. multiplex]MBE0278378.1 NAD kinase [Xylella fastidiosa subsp. multiplex]